MQAVIPVSFDSEYCIYEKVDIYDSDKDTIEYDSDASEKNEKDKKEIEYIEELNNNYSFIKSKKHSYKIAEITETKKNKQASENEILEEEEYLSD